MHDREFFTEQTRLAREFARNARTDDERQGLERLARHYDDQAKIAARDQQTITIPAT